MKLVSFSITNYRSITKANKIPVGDITILIGKNNEGKSNILKALMLAMHAIEMHGNGRGRYSSSTKRLNNSHSYYSWDRDFPIEYQNRTGNGNGTKSIFKLNFQLSESETQEFVDNIKVNINGSIPITITYGKDNKPDVIVRKQGKGSKSFNDRSKAITEFVALKLQLNYIEAIRTDQSAYNVMRGLVSNELKELEEHIDYKMAVDTINRLQQEKLNGIAGQLEAPLKVFLPHIRNVQMKIQSEVRSLSLRNDFEIIIDDGNPTSIEAKGEGIKSLVTLALLKDRKTQCGASIVAIEEPESHLHPEAITQLEKVLIGLTEEHQVIITTHNPIFVNRDNIRSNIIIDCGKAKAAKSIKEIRDVLGVKASDNLMNAKFVLVVEGEEDKLALESILKYKSEKIKRAFEAKDLIIDTLGGASNLSYKLNMLKNTLCKYHVLLDNDDEGRRAWNKVKSEGLISASNVTMTTCQGMSDAEFEDCIDFNIYKEKILDLFGVDLGIGFRSSKKWAVRIKNSFHSNAKPFDDDVEKEVKALVAKCIANSPSNSLCQHKGNAIIQLISSVENMIK